ncbi:MAG: hypothetical protein FJW27_02650 [Acidimicrobiia bacterium]|nr:hypothetical protein [Acidimicrobiia bacterium]
MLRYTLAWTAVLILLAAGGSWSRGLFGQTTPAGAVTPWGEPDLQGVWTDPFDVNLQRASELGNRELFTDEEVAELDRRRLGAEVRPRAERGTVADVAGAYDGVFVSVRPTGRFTSLIVDPPDGRLPPLKPEVQQRRTAMRAYAMALKQHTDTCKEKRGDCTDGTYGPPSPKLNKRPPSYSMINLNRADGPEDRNLGERCMGAQLPAFDGFWRIVQSPGVISIYYDIGQGQGFHRTIQVTDRPHLAPHVREPFGDSRGRWEGHTLVVDVTNFEPYMEFQNSRESLHLVERWTRRDDKTLDYRVTVEDKTTWTAPWMARQELIRQDSKLNRVYYEPRCHEGNQGMVGLLAGARAAERAFAARRGPHPASLDISSNSESLGTGINDPR